MEIKYPFTKDGIHAFLEDALSDIFAELDKCDEGHPEDFDFFVTCGDRSIRVPCLAEAYEGLCRWLEDAEEEANA